VQAKDKPLERFQLTLNGAGGKSQPGKEPLFALFLLMFLRLSAPVEDSVYGLMNW